jgi:hypothetical protein
LRIEKTTEAGEAASRSRAIPFALHMPDACPAYSADHCANAGAQTSARRGVSIGACDSGDDQAGQEQSATVRFAASRLVPSDCASTQGAFARVEPVRQRLAAAAQLVAPNINHRYFFALRRDLIDSIAQGSAI